MADEQTRSSFPERQGEARRERRPAGGRDGSRDGGREPGGFRIRLSDNEMRAARALQDAFQLRSTVAVLGFALRTTAQLLEEGKLDAAIEQQRNEPRRGDGPRGARSEGRSERRQERGPRVDPFARPSRPVPAQPAADDAAAVASDLDSEAPAANLDATSDEAPAGDAPAGDAPAGDAFAVDATAAQADAEA